MSELIQCLRAVRLPQYRDGFDNVSCRKVANAIAEALKTQTAVYEPDIRSCLTLFREEAARDGLKNHYGGIAHFGSNPHLKDTLRFQNARIDHIVADIMDAQPGSFGVVPYDGKKQVPGKLFAARVYFLDKDKMVEDVRARLTPEPIKRIFGLQLDAY